MSVKSANGFGKPFGGVAVRLYRARISESSGHDFRSSKNHFGVLSEVPVFLKYACFAVNSLGTHPVQISVIFMLKFELLKEKNVRDCLGSGCAECVLRKTYAAEEIRLSGQLTAERIIVLIHSSGGSDKRHYSAGLQLVDGFCKEIIVDKVFVIFRVVWLEIPERHVSDNHIECSVFELGTLKSTVLYFRFWVEFLCYSGGQAVEFNAVQTAVFRHFRREIPEEITRSHCRVEDLAAGKSHVFKRRINALYDVRLGVKSGECAFTGGGIFLVREQIFQLGVFAAPVLLTAVECVRNAAPAAVMSKYVLLLGGRMAVFGFDLLQCFYGCNIGGVFCFRTGGVCEIFGETVIANRR